MTNNSDLESNPAGDDGSPKPSPEERKVGFLSREWLFGPVDTRHGDYVLLAHSFASGMIDAASYSNWNVFAAMQTGNTVLLGLATATTPVNPHAWTTTLVAISSYLVGVFFTFHLSRYVCPSGAGSHRIFLFFLFLLQPIFIFVAAALVAANVIDHNPGGLQRLITPTQVVKNLNILGDLTLLSFQAGIQISCSRLLGFNEIPVNVLTSTYCDLMGDVNLFSITNVKRDRRLAAVVLLFAGAVSSGWIMRSSGGLTAVLFTAAGIKMLAAVLSFLFFKHKKG